MAGYDQIYANRMFGVKGAAVHQANFDGPFIPKYKIVDETFFADADENDWTETTYGTTIDHSAVDGGATIITAGGVANDCGELSQTAQWSAASKCGMLAKVKISQITSVCVAVGFVDARRNTNDQIAMEISSAALADRVADSCGMVFDTGASTDVWYVAAANNGTEGTPVAALGTLVPVADTYFYIVVQTDDSGNVTFYYGTVIDRIVAVGYLPAAIAFASTNLLTPYVGFIARDTVAQVCTVSRIITWQEN